MKTEQFQKRKRTVFFCSNTIGSFTSRDLELLKRHFYVHFYYYNGLKQLPLHLIRICGGVLRSDICLCNFADNHALITLLFAKMLHRKTLVIVGGYEVARIKGLKYGLNRSVFFPLVVKTIFKKSDHVLPVSINLREDAKTSVGVDTSNFTVVSNGFDSRKFSPSHEKKELHVTCAARCSSIDTIHVKGIDTFLKAAALLPHIPFTLIGIHPDVQSWLKAEIPKNVALYPPLPQNELLPYYRRSKVYCQLSRREGHPNAICEAMLCECVPVGTDVPGIRQVMGNTGFLVPPGNPSLAAMAIQAALESDRGTEARIRIQSEYSLEKREKAFESIITAYLTKKA